MWAIVVEKEIGIVLGTKLVLFVKIGDIMGGELGNPLEYRLEW